jgi:hypothetical protein
MCILLKLTTFCTFQYLIRFYILFSKCLKILRKRIDKKALRQGRHYSLLFPSPKIMLLKNKCLGKSIFCLNFALFLVLRKLLVKFRYDKFIYIFDFLHIPRFYKGLAKIYFRTCCLMCTTFLILLFVLVLFFSVYYLVRDILPFSSFTWTLCALFL